MPCHASEHSKEHNSKKDEYDESDQEASLPAQGTGRTAACRWLTVLSLMLLHVQIAFANFLTAANHMPLRAF